MYNNIISLEEEVRCDFVVTTERKKLWAVELDLLQKFISVCDKYNLKWFVIAGTLIGAVRHKGFIPWDDDIDVAMPRADYEIFKTLSHEFEHPYFLQHPDNVLGCGYSFATVRNSNTTAVFEQFRYCDTNHGINVDIFPLDNVNEDSFEAERAEIYKLVITNTLKMKLTHPNPTDEIKAQIPDFSEDLGSIQDVYHKIEEIAMRYQHENTKHISWTTLTTYSDEKSLWLRSSFEDYIVMDFEGIPVRVPIGYDEVLTRNYGNYMEFPPISDRGMWHRRLTQIPDKPYKEYLEEMLKKDSESNEK